MSKFKNYYDKINKIAKIKNQIIRFRILIIAVISLFLVTLSGFLISKGTILENVTVQNEFIYGDNVSINGGKALFSDYTYQYNLGNDNWSNELPTTPGDYSVRIESTGAFGIKKHSTPQPFKILPKELTYTLHSKEITYGTYPNITFDVVNNDRVELEYEFDSLNNEKTICTFKIKDIINKDGNSVLSLYNIPLIKEEITFRKKDIVLKPTVSNKTYDEKEILIENKNNVSYNDKLTYDLEYYYYNNGQYNLINYIPTEVGKYAVKINKDSLKIVDEKDQSTLSNYNILEYSFDYHHFEIYKKDITIKTPSQTKEYDGLLLENEDISQFIDVNNSLLSNHKLMVKSSLNSNYINAGRYKNKLEVNILNSKNKDVSSNYNIRYEYGDLIINKFELNVLPHKYEGHVYDGNVFDYNNYVNTKFDQNYIELNNKILPNGEKIYFNYLITSDRYFDVRNASTYKIKFNGLDYYNSTINIENYNINYSGEETFTISKRKLKVKPIMQEDIIYDEKDYYYPIYTKYQDNGIEFLDNTSLASSDTLRFNFSILNESNIDVYEIKNTGKYTIRFNNVDTYNSNFNLDNYELDYSLTTSFNINKKVINVEPDLYFSNYEYGTYNEYPTTLNIVNSPNILSNKVVTLEVQYLDKNNNVVTPIDAGIYKIDLLSSRINYEVDKNIELKFDKDYYLIINKRIVTVYPYFSDINFTYGDNNVKTNLTNKLILSSSSFINKLENEQIILDVDYNYNNSVVNEVLHSGTYDVNYKDFEIINGKKENYDLIVNPFSITINKKNLTFRNELYNKIYDGKVSNLILGKNLFLNETLSYNDTLSLTISSYLNGSICEAKNANNYQFIVDEINLTNRDDYILPFKEKDVYLDYIIFKRDVSLTVNNLKNQYIYGEVLPSLEYIYLDNNNQFIKGQTVSLYYLFNGKENIGNGDVGSYNVSLDYKRVSIKEGLNDVTNNYNITFVDKTFDIIPLDIVVSLKEDYLNKIYDGILSNYEDSYNNFNIIKGKIAYNDKINLKFKYSNNLQVVNVGSYLMSLDLLESSFIGGKENTSTNINNYNISLDKDYYFTINKKDIVIDPQSYGTVTYDGSNKDYYYNNEKNVFVGVNNEKFVFYVNYTNNGITTSLPIDAGIYNVTVDYIKPIGNALLSNYNFIKNSTTLTINKKDLYITLPTILDKTYDGNNIIIDGYIVEGLVNSDSISNYSSICATSVDNLNKGIYSDPKNANTYYYTLNKENIYVNNKDLITKNYNLILDAPYKSFKINKKLINIDLANIGDFEFDGSKFKDINVKYIINGDGFIKSDEFIINILPRFYRINGMNKEYVKLDDTIYVGNYLIDVENITLSNDLMYQNYEIKINNKTTFTVNKKIINISSSIKEVMGVTTKPDYMNNVIQQISYGDYIYDNNSVEFIVNNLPFGVTYDINYNYLINGNIVLTCKDAGKYKINPTFNFLYENKNINNNFDVRFNDSYIEILKASNSFNFNHYRIVKEFDNKIVTNSKIIRFDLVNNEAIVVTLDPINNPLHTGLYDYRISSINYLNNANKTNYNFDYNVGDIIPEFLEITPKSISIKPKDVFITYDGKEHSYNLNNDIEYTSKNSVCEGNILYINASISLNGMILNSVKNVDSYDLIINNHYFNDPMLNNDYIVSYSKGYYFISTKTVDIRLINNFKIYDGKQFDLNLIQYEDIYNSIISGDVVNLSYELTNPLNLPINVGIYELNVISNNRNYYINVINPYIQIDKKILTLTFKELKEVYCGSVIDITNTIKFDVDGLVNGDTIKRDFIVDGTPYRVGRYNFTINNNSNPNYRIVLVNNYFDIIKKDVDIVLTSLNKIYDGNVLTKLTQNELLSILNTNEIYNSDLNDIKFDYILDSNIRDAGQYSLTINNINHDCYNFKIINNVTDIIINKKVVKLYTNDVIVDKNYDGKSYTYVNNNPIDKNLFYDDLDLSNIKLQFSRDGIDLTEPYEFVDAGLYEVRVLPSSIKFINPVNENNYIIYSYFTSFLIINKLNLTIKPIDKTVYYGEEYNYQTTDFEIKEGKLLDNETFVIDEFVNEENYYTYLDEAKSFYVKINKAHIIDFKGQNVSIDKNYNISLIYGYYKIKKRNVTFIGVGKEFIYNGYGQTNDEVKLVNKNELGYGLLSGHTFKAKSNKFATNTFDKVINDNFDVTIYDENGIVVTNYYMISFDKDNNSNLVIKQRDLNIKLYKDKINNNDEVLTEGIHFDFIDKNQLVNGHTVIVRYASLPSRPYIKTIMIKIYDNNQNDVTSNYNLIRS